MVLAEMAGKEYRGTVQGAEVRTVLVVRKGFPIAIVLLWEKSIEVNCFWLCRVFFPRNFSFEVDRLPIFEGPAFVEQNLLRQ